jgi:hypothetical protein
MPALQTTSPVAVLGRLTWMLFGPILLMITTGYIVTKGTGWLTPPDVLFFLILLAMLLGRWLEFRLGTPLTSTGEPATEAHLIRYLSVTPVLGVAIWLVANLISNHWLAS